MKKLLISLLCMVMVVCFMPTMAWADGESSGTMNVSNRSTLQEALKDSSVSIINLTSDIDMGTEAWTPIVVNRPLTINGQGYTINNMKVNAAVLKPSGSGVPGDGGSCDYYAGFIGNNKAALTINKLNFSNAVVDINPVTGNSTGSSILAVVVANNTGTLVYNDVKVDSSMVKGYTKVGLLHGFSQGGSFAANHCTISNSEVVLEADGSAKFAAFSGIIIGYDGANKAKTNGIKLENNTISIDREGENCVDYGDETVTYDEKTGIRSVKDGDDTWGLTCETYAKGSYGTDAVLFEAEIDGYKYETLADANSAAKTGDTLTIIKAMSLSEDVTIGEGVNLVVNAVITGDKGFVISDGASVTASSGDAKAKGTADEIYTELEANKKYVAKAGKLEQYVAPAPFIPPTPSDNVTNSGTTGTDNATTTADINTTASNGTASAVVDKTTADKIVDKATSNQSTEVVVDAKTSAGTATNTTVTLPTDTVKEIADKTDAEVTVKTDAAEVTLDQKAVDVVATKATGADVEIVVEKTKDETKEMEFELKVVSDGVVIGEFEGGNVKVTVKLNATLAALKDAVLTCVHIDDDGTYTKVGGAKNNDGTYTFTTTHFSSYAIMAEEEADKVIAEQEAEHNAYLKDGVEKTTLKIYSNKGDGFIKLRWEKSKGFKVDGYEIYRGKTKSSMKKYDTTKKTSYKNAKYLKKGNRYYYKVRGYRTVGGEKVYTKWSKTIYRIAK